MWVKDHSFIKGYWSQASGVLESLLRTVSIRRNIPRCGV